MTRWLKMGLNDFKMNFGQNGFCGYVRVQKPRELYTKTSND
jgi:hypothetical protein